MKTKHHAHAGRQRSARNAARRTADHRCSARKLCVRCSIIKVIQYRFRAFRQAFGRYPLPDEPLFFTGSTHPPQTATREEMLRQLAQAADAATVQLPPLLKFLALQ